MIMSACQVLVGTSFRANDKTQVFVQNAFDPFQIFTLRLNKLLGLLHNHFKEFFSCFLIQNTIAR